MRITTVTLIKNGWHFVRYKTTNTKRWCHGRIKGSYTFQEAVKIFQQEQEQ